eukprot:RCo030704
MGAATSTQGCGAQCAVPGNALVQSATPSFSYMDPNSAALQARVAALNAELGGLRATSQAEIDRLRGELEAMRRAQVAPSPTVCFEGQAEPPLPCGGLPALPTMQSLPRRSRSCSPDGRARGRSFSPSASVLSMSPPMSPVGTMDQAGILRAYADEAEGGEYVPYEVPMDVLSEQGDWLEQQQQLFGCSCGGPAPGNTTGIPPLNIVCIVVGSRGDVQPFICLGVKLMKTYGHRVRIATHATFHSFVTEHGLDFYPLKGDPEALMQYVAEHPELMTFNPSEIVSHLQEMWEIFESCWHACTKNTDGSAYMPDLMISNPPVTVHIHICEKLMIPLQMLFTFPWTPTKCFPTVWGVIGKPLYSNKKSFTAVDEMLWLGLGPLVNKFRRKLLGLPKVGGVGSQLLALLRVPYIYCFSPALVPKPCDWGPHIDVVGSFPLGCGDLASQQEIALRPLLDFLAAGPPPFYVGFGSIVIEKPTVFSCIVAKALKMSRVRAIMHQGWMRLGEACKVDANVFLLKDPVPHEWLFPRCSAVCHHGGAGTSHTSMKFGKPTIVVPFFGDQEFWGSRIALRGAGPQPIPAKKLTARALAEAIAFCYRPEVMQRAKEVAQEMNREKGLEVACDILHKRLPMVDGKWMVSTYENQRYYPWSGWSSELLPSDRHRWSDSTGLVKKKRDSFPLPRCWSWLGDWQIDKSHPCDENGWAYAVDFPAKFHPKKAFTDMVRRRRWVRARVH